MSKNTTRKGLAFGAGLALISSAFVGSVPASAAPVEGFITLAPSSGYSGAYAVMATASATFSLTATQGPSAIFTGKELKFLVTDPEAEFEPSFDSAGRTALTVDQTATGDASYQTDVSEDLVTILQSGAGLAVGDQITFSEDIADDTVVFQAADTVVSVTAIDGTTSFTFETSADITGSDVTGTSTKLDGTDSIVKVVREARNADNSFVVDSGSNDGTAAALKLKSPGTSTKSVTVQAFVDFVENDKIDELDYISPVRTVTFVADEDLTGQFALTPPNEGNTSLAGTFTTTPLLNGAQTNDAGLLGVVFTRQDSAIQAFVSVDSTTQSTTTGKWAASVNTAEATALTEWTSATAAPAAVAGSTDWGFTAPTGRTGTAVESISVSASKVATIVTTAAHNLRTGDKITMVVQPEETTVTAASETAAVVTVTDTDTFTYALTETTAVTAATMTDADDTFESDTGYSIVLSSQNVFAGDYSGQLAVDDSTDGNFTKVGTVSAFAVIPAAAADVAFSTVASSTLQGTSEVTSNDTTTDALVAAGTLTATITATVLDSEGDALAAGRSVTYSFNAGAAAGTIKVNGLASSASIPALTTDANGQVTFVVTDTTGTAGKKVTITATPEGIGGAASAFSLEWATPALSMYDLGVSSTTALATGSRSVGAGTTQTLQVFVADQFFNAANSADYRLAVSGSGVTEGFVNLVDGKANVVVSDNGVSTAIVSNIRLQKKGTTGAFANTTTTVALTTNTTKKGAVRLALDGSALYGTAADLSDAVAKVALVERDTRVAYAAQPAYDNTVVVAGKAVDSTTGLALANSLVTVSGPSNILFSNGAVDKRGSITVVSDGSGQFAVTLYSTTAQKDTVITATANGASATTKVTFTGIGVGEGTSLVVTAPAAVKPASTFQVKAKLSDAFGNGVDTAAGRMKVTYTGPGIIFGTLPTETDANGELQFSVLLGANDTGSVSVTVSYDQNGDGDYVDAKDLNTSATIAINATGTVAAAGKVNVGSFNGKLVVYALGLDGAKISWKVAGRWGTAVADGNALNRFDRPVGASGVNVIVEIYVNGVKQLTKTVLTK
jgi:hypothetical protein